MRIKLESLSYTVDQMGHMFLSYSVSSNINDTLYLAIKHEILQSEFYELTLFVYLIMSCQSNS